MSAKVEAAYLSETLVLTCNALSTRCDTCDISDVRREIFQAFVPLLTSSRQCPDSSSIQ